MTAPRARTIGIALVLVGVLAGCADEAKDPAVAPSQTPVAPAAPTSTAPASSAATKSVDKACSAIIDEASGESVLERIPDSLIGIGSSLSGDQLDELVSINAALREAIDVAPADIAAPLRSLQVPFQQVQDVVDAGGGSLDMDTSGVAKDVTALMSACADAGFSVAR